jgi:hypothetical protein
MIYQTDALFCMNLTTEEIKELEKLSLDKTIRDALESVHELFEQSMNFENVTISVDSNVNGSFLILQRPKI